MRPDSQLHYSSPSDSSRPLLQPPRVFSRCQLRRRRPRWSRRSMRTQRPSVVLTLAKTATRPSPEPMVASGAGRCFSLRTHAPRWDSGGQTAIRAHQQLRSPALRHPWRARLLQSGTWAPGNCSPQPPATGTGFADADGPGSWLPGVAVLLFAAGATGLAVTRKRLTT